MLAAATELGDCRRALRLEPAEFVEQKAGAKYEVAGIPQIAVGYVALRGFCIGLLDEFFDREYAGADRSAHADIAILDRRAIGLYAEGDDTIALGRFPGYAAGFGEGRRITHDVIGSKRDHDGVTAAIEGKCRPGNDRRPGIAAHRLEQDIGLDADLRELLGDHKPVLVIGHDDGAAEQRAIGNTSHGLLKRRMPAEEWQELLRPAFA